MSSRIQLLLLLGIALVLRIPALDEGLWYDEIWTLVDFGRLPLSTLFTSYGSDNNHPLFTLSARLSLLSFGENAWSLRLPAMLFGVAGVGMLYAFALRVTTRVEAALAGLLLAISYHHVWFSQNARGYTALLFFTLASAHFFLRILEGKGWRAYVPYGILLALGTYTHMTAVFAAVSHAVVLLVLLARPKAPGRKYLSGLFFGLLIATLVSLLLHAAILTEMVQFILVKKKETATPVVTESEWTSPWWAVRAVALSFGAGLIPGLIALAGGAVVLIAGTVAYARQDWKLVVLFLLPGLIGAAVMLGLGRNLWPRFFFFLAGFILLIVLRGVATLARELATLAPFDHRERAERVLFGAGASVLIGAFIGILPRAWGPKQDFEGARTYVEQLRQPGQVVMTAGLTDLPYQRWIETDYVSIDSVEALNTALAGKEGGYLLHTLPTFLASRMPELAAEVKRRGREVKRFPGTVGGGDVVIIRIP